MVGTSYLLVDENHNDLNFGSFLKVSGSSLIFSTLLSDAEYSLAAHRFLLVGLPKVQHRESAST